MNLKEEFSLQEIRKKMDAELARARREYSGRQFIVSQLRNQINAKELEMERHREKVRKEEAQIKNIKTDLYRCALNMDDINKLKQNSRDMYHKYVLEETEKVEDRMARQGLPAQRERIELTLATVKNTWKRDAKIHESEISRVIKRNAILMETINELREEIKMENKKARDLEIQLKNKKGSLTRPKASSVTGILPRVRCPKKIPAIQSVARAPSIVKLPPI